VQRKHSVRADVVGLEQSGEGDARGGEVLAVSDERADFFPSLDCGDDGLEGVQAFAGVVELLGVVVVGVHRPRLSSGWAPMRGAAGSPRARESAVGLLRGW